MSEIHTSILVDYEFVGEWHVFSSKDLPGLYVAHPDPAIAFNDVPVAIEKLIELNQKAKVKAKVEASLDEFLSWVTEKAAPMDLVARHRYSAQRFALLAA